jgi:hypothetical protein
MPGIIYLVQPAELVGTNRYKIGCSKKNDLSRCKNGYKHGTRYIHIMECAEPYNIERQLKRVFTDKFKLIAGREYFEGNESVMITEFFNIVNKYNQSSNPVLLTETHIDSPNKNKNTIEHRIEIQSLGTYDGDTSQLQPERAASTNHELSSDKCNNVNVLRTASTKDCVVCSLSFKTISGFREHLVSQKHITNRAKLYEHMHITPNNTTHLIHTPSEPATLPSYIPSLNTPESVGGPKMYECMYCNQIFKHSSSRSRHTTNCNRKEFIEKYLAENNLTMDKYIKFRNFSKLCQ